MLYQLTTDLLKKNRALLLLNLKLLSNMLLLSVLLSRFSALLFCWLLKLDIFVINVEIISCSTFISWSIFLLLSSESALISCSVLFNSWTLQTKLCIKNWKIKQLIAYVSTTSVVTHSDWLNCPLPALILMDMLLIPSSSCVAARPMMQKRCKTNLTCVCIPRGY